MLEYKANWNEKTIVKIDRFFLSSKTCSNCGWINQDLTLKILSGSGIESDIKQKQVEALPLGESMKPEIHQSLADV